MDLKYGSTSFPFQLPPERLAGVIEPTIPPSSQSPEEVISGALDDCEPMFADFAPGDRVVIITSDITRYTGSEVYLPLLVERLNRQGIPDRNIEILIALGIHRKQTTHEHEKILGPLHGRIRVSDHDCDDRAGLVTVGKTSANIEVSLNRRAVEADRLILTGVIGFHYFAGFGGGRKAILPGIASRQACMASHFCVLNPQPGSGKNPLATTGNLEGNPVHQAMVEACAMVEPDLLLNTVLSPDKRILAAFAGQWREAHERGCRSYRELFSYPVAAKADLVVVSCGGFPKDINLIQAHKSMEYASQALKPGGVMILLAECRDGFGNATFFDWFRHRTLDRFEAALREQYEINGQTAYSLLQKAQRFTIILVSRFPDHQVREMGMAPAPSLAAAMEKAGALLPPRWQALVMPDGGSVLPVAAP
ncbi:nickel-dependent lactate racemase [Oryzomonas japonica]|uniref:Nickel-dependent lactate racemase n=1 Tax=Oryzomonas japonica TaxID=2603858 RepID=A0A7J4ZNJ8_9BACT|nr:nickel-dependent lactate racemase [Oryzomonas japonica]KAB0664306.1 nickel-dependent lactate racemase [Oryzomonas japonica]